MTGIAKLALYLPIDPIMDTNTCPAYKSTTHITGSVQSCLGLPLVPAADPKLGENYRRKRSHCWEKLTWSCSVACQPPPASGRTCAQCKHENTGPNRTHSAREAPNQALGAGKPHLDGLFQQEVRFEQVRCGGPGGAGTGCSSGSETRPTAKAQNYRIRAHALGRPCARRHQRGKCQAGAARGGGKCQAGQRGMGFRKPGKCKAIASLRDSEDARHTCVQHFEARC